MEIASVEEVRQRLGLPEDENIEASIAMSLETSLVYLSNALRSVLSVAVKEDLFYIDPDQQDTVAGFYRLRLSSGFVRVKNPVAVVQSLTADMVAAINCTGYRLMAEGGWVLVPEVFEPTYVKVSYTAGFADGDMPPSWLKEAQIGYALKFLSIQQIGDARAEMAEVFKFVDSSAENLVAAHMRTNRRFIAPID